MDNDHLASALRKVGGVVTFLALGNNQFKLGWSGGERPTLQILNEEVDALRAAGFDIT